jgi:glycosyltransferase involved in cell wall biosynthesis
VNNSLTHLHPINKTSKVRPIKILHVVSHMHQGGIETWLMHILRNIDRDLFQIDFMVHFPEAYEYNDEIHSLGCRIIVSPHINWKRWWTYGVNFQQILREYGPYDVVHSHIDLASGNIVRLAKYAGVPVRIAHSHNDKSQLRAKAGWKDRFLGTLLKFWIAHYATIGLACSRDAAADMFGWRWQSDRRWQILYYGLDLTPFQAKVEPAQVRAELGIPQDAFVIGHVGRFAPQKNHQFLVKIAAEIAKQEPKMRLLLVGTGSLRSEIEDKLAQLGLTDKVIFAGTRSDVPRLMLGAMDVFLFPSLHEGLGLVLIEAQAAGLPCILSNAIPEEADLVQPLMNRLSLSQPASEWAEVTLGQQKANLPIKQSEALLILQKDSSFGIEKCTKNLTDIYSNEYHQKTL